MGKLTGDYRAYMDKDYLGSWDIPKGDDLILTISHAERNEVKNARGSETKTAIHFEGGYKPLILNATNGKAITKALGSARFEDWEGRKIACYVAQVSAFGDVVDAVRVREFAPKDEQFCEECGAEIVAYKGMSPKQIITYTSKNYGKKLCGKCFEDKRTAGKETGANETN